MIARDFAELIEDALGRDVAAWPWSHTLSRWLDALVILEETA